MRWRRQIDYHGSRTYGSSVSPDTGGRIKRIAAWCAARAKQQLKTILKFGIAPATEPQRLLPGDRRGFSLLGLPRDDCPFPEGPARKPPTHQAQRIGVIRRSRGNFLQAPPSNQPGMVALGGAGGIQRLS
jgi:hypothetical protein